MQIKALSLGVAVSAVLAAVSCGNREAAALQRLGSSEAGPGRSMVLTPVKPGTAGGVFRGAPVEIVAFRSEFRFSIADSRDSSDRCTGKRPGGEGLAFVLLGSAPTALGAGGSGLGYQGLKDSIAVEFDLACSPDNSDPEAPHIAIDIDGRVSHQDGAVAAPVLIVDERTQTSFDDAAIWNAWIEYQDGVMEVRVARDGKRPEQANLRAKVPAKLVESRKLWPGFTAANGKGASKQTVAAWQSEWVMVPRTSTPPGPPRPPRKEQLIGPAF